MQVKFPGDFVLCLFPGLVPVPLADLFSVYVSAVQASKILQADRRRVDGQDTVISGYCLFGKHNAAVILSPDKNPVRARVLIFLSRISSVSNFQNDLSVHGFPLFM